MPGKKRRGFSTDYLSPSIDIFSLLHALHTHANSGIRDYLVHRLYDMSDVDIDFCLPQLMCLLLSWDVNRSYRLQEFVIAKCSQSIHLSLKVLWILQAAEYYSLREDERHRVRDLIHTCEMSLVNASIFGEGEHTADGQPANNKAQARINQEKKRLHILNSNYYAEQQEKRRLASPTHSSSSQMTGSTTDAHSPASPERPFIFGTATNAYTARIFSPVNGASGNFSFNQPSSTKHNNNTTTTSSSTTDVAKPPALNPHQSIPVSVEEIYFALSKKVKCEYFNLELQLIHQLILISSHLVKFPPEARKQKLRRMLSTLPSVHTDSLYLPSNIPNAPHYRILRLLGQEAVSLSSRDKAPYLLYMEIEYTGRSCYEYDIYTAYRSNEEIMEESMELIDEATRDRWGDEGTQQEITMADGSKPAIPPAAAEQVNNGQAGDGQASNAATAKPTDKDSHRPPPLNTASLTPAKPANSTHSTHATHSTHSTHDSHDHHNNHSSLSRRASLSRPLDPNQPAVLQIQQQTAEEQEAGIQRVFHDMDTAQTEKASVANVLSTAASSAVGRSNNHPGSGLGEVAQAEREQEPDDQKAQQQRLIRIRPLPQPEIVSPTKTNQGPLFRLSSASQPSSQPDSPSHDILGSSVPRAGHLSSLTELLESEGQEEKEDMYGEERARMDMAALDIAARAQNEKDSPSSAASPTDESAVSVTVSPESTSSTPSPLLSPASESRAEPSDNLLVAATKKMSHAVSSPDLQVQKEKEEDAAVNATADGDAKKEKKSATNHEKKSAKHAAKEGSSKQRSTSSGITSLSSTTPSASTPASTGRPSLQAANEPAYMRNPAWQKLDAAFGDRWDARKRRVFAASPNQHLERWDLLSCIFKSGDDCRQEVLAMQLIMLFDHIWREAKLPLWLRPYSVLITSPTSGLIETIQDATSVDALKKSMMAVDPYASLSSFFHLYFGMQGNDRHVEAVRNFAESMAGYSVICYLLQIKDRHNGNIMLDREGHVIHIDYGFMLSNSPGRNWGWEQSPFKLTSEYITVMTIDSHHSFFPYFRTLVVQGYMEARKHWHVLHLLIQLMMRAQSLPCFAGAGEQGTLQQLRQRFMVNASDEEALQHAMSLIDQSIDNWRTHQYDRFQRMTNGIV